MAAPYESVEEALRSLGAVTGEGPEQVYARWRGLTVTGDDSLMTLMRRALTLNGHAANIRETVEETVRAGGGIGESALQMLNRTGLAGWS